MGQSFFSDSLPASSDSITVDSSSDNNYMPKDMMFIPAEVLYNHIWNNYTIRYNTVNFTNKEDTIMIILREPKDNAYVHPVRGKVISRYGPRGRRIHTGTDVKLQLGDSVLCAFDGIVRLAKVFSGYGNLVLVRHNNGLETLYGHLSKICVRENQVIHAGDLIGLGGRTGRATTEHLHFETRILGEPFNPEKYIDFEKFSLRCDTLFCHNGKVEINSTDFTKKTNVEVKGENIVNAGKNKVNYVIKKGDTLYSLARKYNTTVNEICKQNKITPSTKLKIGMVLKIN